LFYTQNVELLQAHCISAEARCCCGARTFGLDAAARTQQEANKGAAEAHQ
jgi:hypothetical protein